MEIGTSNPAEIPDDTEVYIHGYGVTTVGELRAPLVQLPDDKEDAAIRRWLFFTYYQPTTWPWPSGPIRVGGREYPQSIFNDNRFIRLFTKAADYRDLDVDNPVAMKKHAAKALKKIRRFDW